MDKAAGGTTSPVAALEAIFMTHIDFVSEHPGVPTMLFCEFPQADGADIDPASWRAASLARRKASWMRVWMWMPVAMFFGSTQGLVMHFMLTDVVHIRRDAPSVFSVYCRSIGAKP